MNLTFNLTEATLLVAIFIIAAVVLGFTIGSMV
jgi:hypothetical protein